MLSQRIVTTPSRWFVRGLGLGILLCGALNAVSYFARSDDWGNLLGQIPASAEALGFPVLMWEQGLTYGGYFIDLPALALNMVFAVVVGLGCGTIAVRQRGRLNRLVDEFEESVTGPPNKFHFTTRDLLVVMTFAAVLAASARLFLNGRPEVLGAIYLLGPWLLVTIALLPRKIAWQQRVLILVPAALLLILAAILSGASLKRPVEFDKVLLGIFVCWTPQSALAALGITFLLVVFRKE